MKIADLADIVYRDLDLPEDVSIPAISFWLSANLGQLNILIGTSYGIDDVGEATPELGEAEAAILKYLYLVHYYTRLVRLNLGAGAYDFSELSEGDTTIRKASRTELSKTYTQAKNALEDRLNRMIFLYRQNLVVPQSLSAVHDLIKFNRV